MLCVVASEKGRTMPDLYSRPTVLLDATLRRDGEVRQWIIRSRDIGGWDCQVLAPGAVTVCVCETLDLAMARLREWNTEIEVARVDGWR
jgi:hypothetical protein